MFGLKGNCTRENYHYENDGTVIEHYDFDSNTKLEPIINVQQTYPQIAKEKGNPCILIKYICKQINLKY